MRRAGWIPICLATAIISQWGTAAGATGLGSDRAAGGPEALVTGALSAVPNGLTAVASAPSCSGAAAYAPSLDLSWGDSQSATLDAAGGYLVSGYAVSRATSSSGPYSVVQTVTGAPPATTSTDAPSGPAGSQALVVDGTAAGSAKAYQLSESSLSVTGSISIGTAGDEPNAVQITPDGLTAVLAEATANQVQVLSFSGGTWTLVKTLTVSDPTAVAVDPVLRSGSYVAYVASPKGSGLDGVVYPLTLNGASSSLGGGIAVAQQADPTSIVVTPDGSEVYVANGASSNVSAIATATGTATTIALPHGGGGPAGNPQPVAMAVTPDSSHVYVADKANSYLDDITVASNTVGAHVSLPASALKDSGPGSSNDASLLAMEPDGTSLYVAEFGAAQVQQVNTALATSSPDSIAATISTGTGSKPVDLALSPNGCLLYVADGASNNIDLVTTASNAESTAFAATCHVRDPQAMEVTPDDQYLVVSENKSCGDVQLLATSTGTVTTLGATAVGNSPEMVAVPPTTYDYEVSASHQLWSSAASAPAGVTLGWNPGGWQ